MAVIVEFDLAPEAFPMGAALSDWDVSVELERTVPTGSRLVPFVWVSGVGVDGFTEQVAEDPVVESVEELERFDDTALLRVEWSDAVDGVVSAVRETDAGLLDVRWAPGWKFRLRFADRDDATEFSRLCSERSVDLDIRRVYVQQERSPDHPDPGLTPKQREALRLAYRRGYFETPKRVTLGALADELDISQQALSTRIRRGNERLLASVLDVS
jgi:predicted DNA binding protein